MTKNLKLFVIGWLITSGIALCAAKACDLDVNVSDAPSDKTKAVVEVEDCKGRHTFIIPWNEIESPQVLNAIERKFRNER